MAFQFRRGTDAERQSITPKPGEPLYVTDTGQVYVGDGTTQGGNLVSISVSDDDSPSLGGNLDLNGNNIVGTGNIDIDGYITATGNINLGDGAEDNVIVGGVISSSLIPAEDGLYDLGDSASRWRNGFFEGAEVGGEILAGSLRTGSIYSQDSSTIYDADLDTITVSSINSDLVGSVFGDDSTTLVDAVTNSINLEGMSLNFNSIELDNADRSLVIQSANENERAIIKIFSQSPDYHLRVDGLTDGTETIGNLYNTSRGTLDAKEPVQPGDPIFLHINTSWDGVDTIGSTAIISAIDENATVQEGSAPGKLLFLTFTEDNINTSKGIAIDKDGRVAISHPPLNYTARETLDVNGGGIFEGSVEAASFIGSLMSDDSNTLIDAITGEVLAPIRDITVVGDTGTPTSNTDNLSPVEWLEITVNNNTRYIPLYE